MDDKDIEMLHRAKMKRRYGNRKVYAWKPRGNLVKQKEPLKGKQKELKDCE